jgi:hypothetical protein
MIVTRASILLRGLALAGVLGVVVTWGCSGVDPCDNLHVGDQFAITIVDAPDGGSFYDCGFGFDLSQGQILEATVVDQSTNGQFCKGSIATIAPFGAWTWTLTSTNPDSDVDLAGSYAATNGSCSGTVYVAVSYGRYAGLTRDFEPNGSASPECHSCRGSFDVSVQKVSGP